MAMKFYSDNACTSPIKSPQSFVVVDASDSKTFTLTDLLGTDVGEVYRYDGAGYTKLVLATDYTVVGNTVVLIADLVGTLIVTPVAKLALNFGGNTGDVKVTSVPIWLKRDPGFVYSSLTLRSLDLDKHGQANQAELMYGGQTITGTLGSTMDNLAGQTQTGCLLTGIAALLNPGILEGFAVSINQVYWGRVLANSDNAVLTDSANAYVAQPGQDSIDIYPLGTLQFAVGDGTNTVPADNQFKPVATLPTLQTGKDSIQIWVRNTVTIPSSEFNVPNQAFMAVGIEFTE